jgi:lipoyl(octanoyl) transferase
MTELLHLPTLTSTGAANMALDEVLLDSATIANQPMLRFYGWATPTVTLGYFQPAADRLARPGIMDLAWVRRPTGGTTLVHDSRHEFTYALALPGEHAVAPDAANWICQMHYLIRDALASLGVQARAVVCGEEARLGPVLCFQHQTPGDLLIAGRKVAGSAQRKVRGAILQHGSVALSQSPYTPELPGVLELAGKRLLAEDVQTQLLQQFTKLLNWSIRAIDWQKEWIEEARQRDIGKYSTTEWNEKR